MDYKEKGRRKKRNSTYSYNTLQTINDVSIYSKQLLHAPLSVMFALPRALCSALVIAGVELTVPHCLNEARAQGSKSWPGPAKSTYNTASGPCKSLQPMSVSLTRQ